MFCQDILLLTLSMGPGWHLSAGGETKDNTNSSSLSWYRDPLASSHSPRAGLPLSHTLAPVLIKTWQATPKLVKFRNWLGPGRWPPVISKNSFTCAFNQSRNVTICRALPTCFFLASLPSWHLSTRLDSRIGQERSMEMIIITVKTLQNKKAGHLTLLMKHTRHTATQPLPPRHRHDKVLHINFLSSQQRIRLLERREDWGFTVPLQWLREMKILWEDLRFGD